jgi:hypothetical protein
MSRSFSKIVAVAFVLTFTLGIARTSFAQDMDKDVVAPITKQGSYAGIFELAGLGNFGIGGPAILGFPSSAVGMEYFISDGTNVFVLLGFNSQSGTPGNTTPDSTSAKPSTTAFGFGAGIQMHCHPVFSTSPYWGGMVSFGSSSGDEGQSGSNDVKNSSSTFGVAALGGFDWFFTRGLCLGGEMQLGFSSTSSSHTGPAETGTGSTTTNYQSVTTIALLTSASVHLKVFLN